MGDRVDARLRVTCQRCGTIEVPAAEVRLVIARPDLDDDPRNLVEFGCPTCELPAAWRVDERTTRLVTAAGVPLVAARPESPRTSRFRGPERSG